MTAHPRKNRSKPIRHNEGRPGTWPSPGAVPVLIDVETLAGRLGVGVRLVRRLVAERRIPYVKVGHYVRFDVAEVATWIDERRIDTFVPAARRRTGR